MEADMNAIAEYIRDELAFDGDLSPDMDLLEEQILDSFSIVQIAMFLQENFDIELEENDLQRDNLATLNSMMALVASKRSN